MPKRNHTHKLKLHTFKNGTKVFFCIDDCDYRIARELALGKMTICFRCGNPFQLNQYSLNLVKPHCEDCHLRKSDIQRNKGAVLTAKPVKLVESVMAGTASRIGSSLRARLDSTKAVPEPNPNEPNPDSEVKSQIQMLTEDELL
jgi:hypothetical protein